MSQHPIFFQQQEIPEKIRSKVIFIRYLIMYGCLSAFALEAFYQPPQKTVYEYINMTEEEYIAKYGSYDPQYDPYREKKPKKRREFWYCRNSPCNSYNNWNMPHCQDCGAPRR